MNNPFNITKAVDYTDSDIMKYWVDITDGHGFKDLLKPTSNMPMLILGSKGSGKTHLMRYFSFQLQKLRYNNNIKECIENDRYVGIYLRCSGLNSDRFKGKGQEQDAWDVIFSYYFELWIGQLVLDIISDLNISPELEKEICSKSMKLFEKHINIECTTIQDLIALLKSFQKNLDYQVNNAAITRKFTDLEILVSAGRITFGLPEILSHCLSCLKGVTFLYLIDEVENISKNQQKLINTLYRERANPVTFRLGARLYGMKTYETLGGGEENKDGSEFEKIILDEFFRANADEYDKFVREICMKRLNQEGLQVTSINDIDSFFERFNFDEFSKKIKTSKYKNVYFERLNRKLTTIKGLTKSTIDLIINNLSFSDDLLVERTKVLLFYREWSEKKSLLLSSEIIYNEALEYSTGKKEGNRINAIIANYKNDIISQLARETREKLPYYELSNFIKMSSGIPRNLLNILKHAFRWSYFSDHKKPFIDGKISFDSQFKGVIETADWFFEDNRIPAAEGKNAYEVLKRIGAMLQAIRFSDIPPECSLCTIAIKSNDLNVEIEKVLDFLESYSFIIEVEKRRDKNSNEYLRTFQINGIIAPKWELAISRRGVLLLNKKELDAIFNNNSNNPFVNIINQKIEKYTAPFFTNDALTLFDL